jgi:ATP-dependent Clp protease ATP-binding subunit ClpA
MQQNNRTIEAHFFYGPSSELSSTYQLENLTSYITLLQLASRFDTARLISNKSLLQLEEEALVVWPEEFFGVRDNFTNSLWRNILETNLQKVYIANPPRLLVEQAKLLGLDVSEQSHNYQKVSLGLIKKVTDQLRAQIVGQDQAISLLSRALASMLNEQKKPVVVMLYGPTGIGKTESAKIIARALGGEASRIQFSMMQTNSLVEFLYGSRINSRSFAADLLERQSNVVIFDEFDKTGSTFHSAFYQLFDEGIFIDKNYRVDMQNSLIVCTSNYTSPEEIRKHLGDPLSSRFSAFIKYEPLSQSAKTTIIQQKIDQIYESYPHELQKSIDKVHIERHFMHAISKLDNVREITNAIEYIVSDFILKSLDKQK